MTIPRSQYDTLASKLSHAAERNAEVQIYLSSEDIAEALGDYKYRPDKDSPWELLRSWIIERRRLGFEPSADDIVDWAEEQE